MIIKEKCEEYFQRVLALERTKISKMQELMRIVRDPGLRGSLADLFKDKTRHETFTAALFGILQGVAQEEDHAYVFMRRLLDSVLSKESHEKRRYVREPFLGVVRMRDLETKEECHVKCIDVSPGGVGIENDKALTVGRFYALEVTLYKHSMPTEQTGKLVWMKEIIPGTFIGGIQFEGI